MGLNILGVPSAHQWLPDHRPSSHSKAGCHRQPSIPWVIFPDSLQCHVPRSTIREKTMVPIAGTLLFTELMESSQRKAIPPTDKSRTLRKRGREEMEHYHLRQQTPSPLLPRPQTRTIPFFLPLDLSTTLVGVLHLPCAGGWQSARPGYAPDQRHMPCHSARALLRPPSKQRLRPHASFGAGEGCAGLGEARRRHLPRG